jgi:hypothetical protein
MPISETTITNKANDYKGWAKLAMFGLVVIILLVIAVGVFAFYRMRSNAGSSSLPQDSILSIDTAAPEAAAETFNEKLIAAVEGIDTANPEDALNTLLSSLLGAQVSTDSAKFAITYSGNDGVYTNTLDFQGDIKRNDDGTSSLQGSATITIQNKDIDNLIVPADLIVVGQTAYIRIGETTGEVPASYAPALQLFSGKWIKVDLSGFSNNETSDDVLDPAKRQELLNRWKQNPPLLNAKSADSRVVNGTTLQCMIADVNPAALPESESTPVAAQPLEICNANGNAPVYFGATTSQSGQDIVIGVTFFSFGAPVTIVAPTENVVDFSSLF